MFWFCSAWNEMIKISYMMKDNTLQVYVLLVCMLLFFISSTMEAVLCAQHCTLSCPILAYLILSYRTLSYPILSYPIVPYPILSYPILLYLILSYRTLSYPILSRHIIHFFLNPNQQVWIHFENYFCVCVWVQQPI